MNLIKLLSVVLLVLPFMATAYAQPQCSLVELNTSVVQAFNNEKTTVAFTLRNSSGETFYLDRVNVYDFESGIISRVKSFDKKVLPGKTALIAVEFDVFGKKAGQYRAFLQARGHFQNQSTCNYFELGEKEVTIIVEKAGSTGSGVITGTGAIENFASLDCKAIDVIVPEKTGIMGNEGEITINVYNLSGNGMNILLTGSNLKLKSNFIHLPDNTEKNVAIEFTAEKDRTFLVYRIEVPGCTIFTKETEIVKLNAEATGTAGTGNAQDTNASVASTAFASLAEFAGKPAGLLFLVLAIIIIALIAAVYIKDRHIREQQSLVFLKRQQGATEAMTQGTTKAVQ